jgi:peroxiredoxin
MTQFLRNNLSQLRGAESFTPFLQIREKYFSVFLELQKTYGNTYNELFFEPEYLFSTLFHPVQNELYYYSINQNSLKSQEIQESAAYITYISDKALATKKYIEQSSWLPISFYTSAISRNDDELNNYSLNNELNIPHGYFNQFLTNTVNQTNNDEIAGSILLQRAQRVSYMSPERAKILIEEIKNKYPTFSGITNGRISSIERKLIIIKGVEAPNFSVTTLDGKNFTLSDLKGKYVFLDFWGTWCGPCRSEIPNMIKMHKSLPTNSIVILGLSSGDKKDKLEKFIVDNNMEYANAMCTDQILELYGVNSFPSTFLIDPQGKIVAKNLRGSNLHEMVLQQMK